jgi:hypothetical protein
MSCARKYNASVNPPKGNISNLKSDNRRDKFSNYKLFLSRVKMRSKEKSEIYDIDLQYIFNLWNSQNGICPLTGWKMLLPTDPKCGFISKDIKNASLDRIDSSIGYIKGNVRFVCVMANYAKNVFHDNELIQFCNAVTFNNKLKKSYEN